MPSKVPQETSAGKTAAWDARGTGAGRCIACGPSVKTAAGVPGEAVQGTALPLRKAQQDQEVKPLPAPVSPRRPLLMRLHTVHLPRETCSHLKGGFGVQGFHVVKILLFPTNIRNAPS